MKFILTVIPGRQGFVVVRDGVFIENRSWSRVIAGPFATAYEASVALNDLSMAGG